MITCGIPTLNRYDKLQECLKSIEQGTLVAKVVVIDNGGKLPELNPALDFSIYTPVRNMGVAKSWNWLLQTVAEPLLICNDDITFGENDIQAFHDIYMTTDAGVIYADNLPFLNMFSCFMVRPTVIEKIGLFDEEFFPAYFEDCDYFRRMVLGEITWQSVSTKIKHTASSTLEAYTNQEMNKHHENFRKNQGYYVRKWGGEPKHEKYHKAFNQ